MLNVSSSQQPYEASIIIMSMFQIRKQAFQDCRIIYYYEADQGLEVRQWDLLSESLKKLTPELTLWSETILCFMPQKSLQLCL